MLFATLERTLDRIWRITRRRRLLVATLGPLMMLARVSAFLSTPLITTSTSIGLVHSTNASSSKLDHVSEVVDALARRARRSPS